MGILPISARGILPLLPQHVNAPLLS